MDNINTPKAGGDVKRIPTPACVILAALTTLSAALIPTSYGGLLTLILAAALEALLLIAEPSFAAYLPIPLSYALSAALITYQGQYTADAPLIALTCLVFVPCAFGLRICYAKKCSLSVTLIVLTVLFALCFGFLYSSEIKLSYGSVTGGIQQIRAQVGAGISEMFEKMNTMLKEQNIEDEMFSFTEETIRLLKKELLMILPAMYIVLCEIAAYISEKLMRLSSHIFRCSYVATRWERVTLSAGMAVIFLISYAVSSIIVSESVIYYSAENIMLIILPFAAVCGLHSMFGSNGFFRKSGKGFLKVMTVLVCIMALMISPLMLFILFALWGAFSALSRAIVRRALEKNGKNDGEK